MNDFPAGRFQPLQDELDLIFRSFRLDGERIIRTSTGEEVKWSLNSGGYPIARAGSRKDSSRRLLLLHRVNFALTHGWLPVAIDHIDGDRLNYAIANLRPCTPSENMANSLYLGKPLPKSGLRNVVLLPSGRFGAKVSQGGMSHWLGTFDTADEAKQAVEAFKREHRGEFYREYKKIPKGPPRVTPKQGEVHPKTPLGLKR